MMWGSYKLISCAPISKSFIWRLSVPTLIKTDLSSKYPANYNLFISRTVKPCTNMFFLQAKEGMHVILSVLVRSKPRHCQVFLSSYLRCHRALNLFSDSVFVLHTHALSSVKNWPSLWCGGKQTVRLDTQTGHFSSQTLPSRSKELSILV